MNYKGIDLKKVEKMAGLSFQNGIRLHLDSILLFENSRFPSAYYLSILSLEEIGKAFKLEDFWWHSRYDGRESVDLEEKDLYSTYSHSKKQIYFANFFNGPILAGTFSKNILEGKLEISKQNSVYVGLKKTKKGIDLKSKIINPLKISKNKAEKQITIVNDCLLELILGVIVECYMVETENVEELLNRELFDELKNRWTIMRTNTKSRLKEFENIE